MSDGPLPSWLREQLFARRIVVLRGELDDHLAGEVTAELMMLDATGDGPVTLHVDSSGGQLDAAFAVVDTIDLLGVPVEAVCVGRAEGSAVGVVAAAHRRQASRHARFQLCEPTTTIDGRADQIEAWAVHHQQQVTRFVARLAKATGQPVEHVEADVEMGRWFTADEAVAYGLVDQLWSPSSGEGGRPNLGFGPQR